MAEESRVDKNLAYIFGFIFVTALLILAVAFPAPTPFQYTVFKTILALAVAGVAAVIPGVINFGGPIVRAGGAIAIG